MWTLHLVSSSLACAATVFQDVNKEEDSVMLQLLEKRQGQRHQESPLNQCDLGWVWIGEIVTEGEVTKEQLHERVHKLCVTGIEGVVADSTCTAVLAEIFDAKNDSDLCEELNQARELWWQHGRDQGKVSLMQQTLDSSVDKKKPPECYEAILEGQYGFGDNGGAYTGVPLPLKLAPGVSWQGQPGHWGSSCWGCHRVYGEAPDQFDPCMPSHNGAQHAAPLMLNGKCLTYNFPSETLMSTGHLGKCRNGYNTVTGHLDTACNYFPVELAPCYHGEDPGRRQRQQWFFRRNGMLKTTFRHQEGEYSTFDDDFILESLDHSTVRMAHPQGIGNSRRWASGVLRQQWYFKHNTLMNEGGGAGPDGKSDRYLMQDWSGGNQLFLGASPIATVLAHPLKQNQWSWHSR